MKRVIDGCPGTVETVAWGNIVLFLLWHVDGQLVTHSLWSKLHTGKWPQWPQWQQRVEQLLPIFHLKLRIRRYRVVTKLFTFIIADSNVWMELYQNGVFVDSGSSMIYYSASNSFYTLSISPADTGAVSCTLPHFIECYAEY